MLEQPTNKYTFITGEDCFVIPTYMREGLERYISDGIPCGDFLRCIICNDFIEACSRADCHNISALPAYANFLWNYAPSSCFGSDSNYNTWISHRGLSGQSPV